MAHSLAEVLKQPNATILDVRSPEEYRTGAYPGAVNIPVNLLASRLAEVPKDATVVVYCAAGGRSAAAAALLKQAGYPNVHDAGGIKNLPR